MKGMRFSWIAAGASVGLCLAVPFLKPAASAPARIGHWVEVGIATNGVQALVNTDTIVAGPGSVEVQQRFVMPRGAARRTAYVDQRVVYACFDGVAETLSSIEYDASGRVLRQDGADRSAPYRVMPGTLPHYILDVLC